MAVLELPALEVLAIAVVTNRSEPACWCCGRLDDGGWSAGRFRRAGRVLICLDCGARSLEPADLTLARHERRLRRGNGSRIATRRPGR